SVLRLTGQFPFIPTAKVVHASTSPTALSNAQPSPSVDPCPPITISGTVGAGSPDYPFITGIQASRLFRNAVESDCGSEKPNPGVIDIGINFKYDAYTFRNTTILPICVTIITTNTAANQILAVAYEGSFDPADVDSNYL